MDFDPKIRLRPWQTALLGVAVATGLVLVFAPEVSLIGSGAEPPSGPPTPTTVVPSAPLTTTGPEPQEVVPESSPIGRAGEQPTAGRSYGPPLSPLLPNPLASNPLVPSARTTCIPQSSDVALTVVSFNTHSARGNGGVNMDDIAAEIRNLDPDVVLLQEIDRNRAYTNHTDQPGYYARALGMNVAFGVNTRQGAGEYGVATLSKYPIVSQANTLLPNDPNSGRDQQRGVLYTRIQVGDSYVSVYNTHLQHHFDSLRVRQMQGVMALVKADPLPTIVGGDLNSGPNTTTLQVARSVLRDAWESAGVGSGNTVPKGRIDFVLYSEPLVAQTARVYPSRISDHYPLYTRFTMSGSGTPICVPVFDEPLS